MKFSIIISGHLADRDPSSTLSQCIIGAGILELSKFASYKHTIQEIE